MSIFQTVTTIVDDETTAAVSVNGEHTNPDGYFALRLLDRDGCPLAILGAADELARLLATWTTQLAELRRSLTPPAVAP